MTLDTLISLVCAIFVIAYILVFEVNWHWIGFKKKGRK